MRSELLLLLEKVAVALDGTTNCQTDPDIESLSHRKYQRQIPRVGCCYVSKFTTAIEVET